VSVDVVISNLKANSEAARAIVSQLAGSGLPQGGCACASALEHAIMTDPERIPADARAWVRLLAGDRPGTM
jgi:hypothetical protein